MWINSDGLIYEGEMRVGDREATTEEIEDWERERAEIVPTEVSGFQLRAALLDDESLSTVEAYMAETADDVTALAWNHGSTVPRRGLVVEAIELALTRTGGDIDDLFRSAATFSLG